MKKALLTMLLIFSTAVTTIPIVAANEGEDTLKTVLQDLYTHCGTRGKSMESAYYTNFVQEIYTIKPFSCERNNSYLKNALKTFENESKNECAYIYVEPDQEGTYDVKLRDTTIPLRVNDELMWMITKKNSGDARLIDIYALSFSEDNDGIVNGTVALITKQRSDLVGDETNDGSSDADLLSDRVLPNGGKVDEGGELQSANDVSTATKGKGFPTVLNEKLDSYQYLLNQYRNEITYINSLQLTYTFRADETKKLLVKMEGVTGKIETLVNDYINNLNVPADVGESSFNASREERSVYLKTKIDAYQYLLNQYRNEIAYINSLQLTYNFRADETKKLLMKMEGVTANMETLINEYVRQIE